LTLPPLSIQRRIAEILGRLDDKIEVNRRIDRTLEAMAQALYRHWFVEFGPFRDGEFVESELGMIPKGWEAGRLSNLCSTQYGYTASATDKPVGPKLLRVTDINKRNWIEWGSVPHCVISADDRSKYALEVGDIVVARMADPGKSAIVEEAVDAVFASYLVRLKTNSLAYAYFVYEFLKSPQYGEYAEGAKGGSVQANMNAKIIVGADLVIPPVPVLAAFLAKVLPLRQRLVASVKESSVLASVRDYLLPKLLSGEVEAVGAAVHE
jgi:type I restriction enzyme S subunit